jgi:hypothetical protein
MRARRRLGQRLDRARLLRVRSPLNYRRCVNIDRVLVLSARKPCLLRQAALEWQRDEDTVLAKWCRDIVDTAQPTANWASAPLPIVSVVE